MGKQLNPAHSAAQVRRELYYAARREGLDKWEAGAAAGVGEPATIRRYERWFQAVESGQEFLPRGDSWPGK